MGRFISRSISEFTAVAFALFLFFFFYEDFWQAPTDVEASITHTYWFCAICAAYWWFQSGTLALAGARSAQRHGDRHSFFNRAVIRGGLFPH